MLAPVASGPISSNPVLASDGQKRVSESALEFMGAYFVYSYPCFDPRASRTVAGL